MRWNGFGLVVGGILSLGLLLASCSGENGADGRDADPVDVDSLATAVREEVTESLWDTLYAKPYVDTVYKILFDNAFGTAWMDSTRRALVDSLKQADYDSLYAALYDSVYYDIYSQSIIKQLDAYKWTVKEGINLAFANQYPLMYKDYVNSSGDIYPVPVSVIVRNECPSAISIFDTEPCSWKKIMVKAWITDWTDTGSVSGIVNPDTTDVFAPPLTFDMAKAAKIKAPEKVNIQIRAYALENDHEILFYSASEPTTLYPVQVNGSEQQGVKNRNWWYGVWVTPNMDSIPNILNDLKKKLPEGSVKVYQKYSDDETMAESSSRVVKAVFEILQARQIKYVMSNGSGTPGQKINYPIETLRLKQGVCIETAVLFASILETLGMQVFIVVTPDHAFVGWRTEKNGNTLDFVETTLLGGTSSYAYANSSAIEKFNELVDAGSFESGEAELIDIEAVRKYGIVPNDIP
ncbi:MAG: hypothetical protein IJ896_10240 [Fibrobacter sp.]|nr:hypothetical protein [Fibrobacter sp.]